MKKIILSILTLYAFYMVPPKAFCEASKSEHRFDGNKITLSDKEWKSRLTPEQFKVLRQGGTEKPFENAHDVNLKKGIYVCEGCELPLFNSRTKYNAKTGWPSFWKPIWCKNLTLKSQGILFNKKMEVSCSRCGGHLGHVFSDGPKPTGKRYSINSAALKFISQE